MYYADLDKYVHPWVDSSRKTPIALAVGWLDREYPYNQGDVSSDFLNCLWNFCTNSPVGMLGYHECSFCEDPPFGLLVKHNGQELVLGASEIWVFGKNGLFFAAPDLIYHYIISHHYRPPEKFIQAVIHSPQPDSDEYKRFAKKMGWTWVS